MNSLNKIYPAEMKKANNDDSRDYHLLFSWNDCVAESEAEYLERVRKRKLLSVMKSVIENELSAVHKEALFLRHLENKSYDEIGKTLCISPSAALRSVKKAESIVSSYMKYAIEFADIGLHEVDKPLDVKMAISHILLENSVQEKIGTRLRQARMSKLIPLHKAAFCTGITEERINLIEETGHLNTSELKKLISFYGVSADYIVFGVK